MKKIVLACSLICMALPVWAGGDPEAGKTKSAVCAGCHGADGNSTMPMFPKLAGQHPDYLYHALLMYKTGKRMNPIMQMQAGVLSEQDMMDLAAYYSRQSGLIQKY